MSGDVERWVRAAGWMALMVRSSSARAALTEGAMWWDVHERYGVGGY